MTSTKMIPWDDLNMVVAQHRKANLLPSNTTVEQVTMCLAVGHQLGVNPYEAIRGIVVVDGKATIMASLLQAIVQRDLPEMQLEILEYTRESCRVRGRKDQAHPWLEISYDLEDAKDAGLLGKRNWKAHKKQMLFARASTILYRIIGARSVHGLYTPDEMGADEDPEMGTTSVTVDPTPATSPAPSTPSPAPSEKVVDAPFEETPLSPEEGQALNEAEALAARVAKAKLASTPSDPKPPTSQSKPESSDSSDGSPSPKASAGETGKKDPQGKGNETWTLRARRIADGLKAAGITKTQIQGVKVLRIIKKQNPDATDAELLDTATAVIKQDAAGEENQAPEAEPEQPKAGRRTKDGNPRNTFWRELTKLSGEDLEHKLTEMEDVAEEAMIETGDVEIMARAQATCPSHTEDGTEYTWDSDTAPDQMLRFYSLSLFDSVTKARTK